MENKYKKILIIDDNAKIINMISEILHKNNYEVLVAKDGKTGIERAELGNPDLILLDIMMPDLDGYETCALLKNNEKTKSIPIIFISALVDELDKVKALEMGASDFISKPINDGELLIRIKTHITISELTNQLMKAKEELALKFKNLPN